MRKARDDTHVKGEELVTANCTRPMIRIDFLDFLKYGFGALALLWLMSVEKYFSHLWDYWMFVDVFTSGIVGVVWVLVRERITAEFEPKSTNFALVSAGTIIFALVIIIYFGFKASVLKLVVTSFGAAFTTILTLELALSLVRKDYQNYRRISENEFIFIRPDITIPYKKTFLAFSILVFLIGAAGMAAAEIKKERENAITAAKNEAINKKFKLRELEKQAEANGSAYILYTYSKIQPENEREAKVNALLKIDLGMDKKTQIIYPWDKNYPGYGGKFSQVIR